VSLTNPKYIDQE
jgi:hypothetical protein